MNDLVLVSNAVDVSDVPSTITILPFGMVDSQKGNFIVDEESFNLMYKAFKDRNLDIVIDYEHQTLNDQQAPAGGWIKDLSVGKDGILAKVEWTSRAKDYLKNKEYRYLSPVIMTRKKDGKAVLLHSVALTNTPAINGMKPIINSMKSTDMINSHESEPTDSDESSKSKGDSDSDTTSPADEFLNQLKELLSLPEDTSLDDLFKNIIAIIKSQNDASKELSTLKYDLKKQEIEETIMSALKQGKISMAMRPAAETMAYNDLEAFKNYIKVSPQVVPMGRIQYATNEQIEQIHGRNDYYNSDAARLLRVNKEDYKKYSE